MSTRGPGRRAGSRRWTPKPGDAVRWVRGLDYAAGTLAGFDRRDPAVGVVLVAPQVFEAVPLEHLTPADDPPHVREVGRRDTGLGPTLYVKVFTPNYRVLTWREVWDAFHAAYPDRWAVQFFPPAAELVDDANVYHLYVLADAPVGVSVRR